MLIYCIGDSHASFFNCGKGFSGHVIGSMSAYNLKNRVADILGKAVGVDACHSIIDSANKTTADNGLNCTFVSYDIMGYNEAEGGGGAYGKPTDRYRCEALIAPAIIHHLSVQGHSIVDIIKRFTEYAYGWMLIEWVPGYGTTLNQVVDAIKSCGWSEVGVKDSSPMGRKWLLCDK